ncbi:glucuronyl hydrolase [Flavobacterium nackdongense]|uniref:Glucuronyl hydrolase n=2 Tax=Flavobacterium nackdongense TaxID=2547394 RepID=A0A4P6YBT9_9FLAO|nr:glucuronyl hydrolase [Flavobacterium nackdongense]
MRRFYIILFYGLLLFFHPNAFAQQRLDEATIQKRLNTRFEKLLEYPIDSLGFPRSMSVKTGLIKKVPSKDWTSGFYVGNLWQLYIITGDTRYKEYASQWNPYLEKEKFNGKTHDMGFKIYCSYGKGYEITQSEAYKKIIIKSAQTLSTRFSNKVGSLKSWDNRDRWEFPVIIDNMMNLELLFEASKLTGDDSYRKIAIQHANTTLKNHFRKDNSCYHVLGYDSISGKVISKNTHQGYSDASSWARGQAWAVYGFTMAYRYTMDKSYLKQAEATAQFFINHKNLPVDGIPYWDFDVPNIPNTYRDASAAAIMASALIELYSVTKNEMYLNYSNKVIQSLSSDKYLLHKSVKGPFILDHCTGDWSKKLELDEPIVYGDYYFLETLIRKKALK